MMTDGLQLMVIGMGVVFLFLILLVMLMSLMTAVVQRSSKVVEDNRTDNSAADRIAAVLAVVAAQRRN
jgi:sodium pump decarboxylase gamma subunit